MKVTLLGTRGSFPSTRQETRHYGGNTSCVEVTDGEKLIILDAGTGILSMNSELTENRNTFHILLTHLHIDHIQGLGFFKPLFNPDNEVHIYGPTSSSKSLRDRLNRYFSPPIFPLHFRDIPGKVMLHEISNSSFEVEGFRVESRYVCHPGPTVGFRISAGKSAVAYLPDHEHLLGSQGWHIDPKWISGFDLAEDADLLIHDSQYTREEYADKVGWGHSTFENTIRFAEITRVKKVALFHHDPDHSDEVLEGIYKKLLSDHDLKKSDLRVELAEEGKSYELG